MTKINCNIYEITGGLKELPTIKPGRVTLQGKTYTLLHVEKISWKKPELISRRLLGGALVALTLGFILLHKPVRAWFKPTKAIHVKAVLTPDLSEPQLPPPPLTSPFTYDFNSLPEELIREIALKLEKRELYPFIQTSKKIRTLAQKVVEDKQLALYLEIEQKMEELRNSPDYRRVPDDYQAMLQTLEAYPKLLMQFLFRLSDKNSVIDRNSIKFLFMKFNQLPLDIFQFLSEYPLEDSQRFLKLVLDLMGPCDTELGQKLYFEYASPPTFIQFAQALVTDNDPPMHGEINTWLDRIDRGFEKNNPEEIVRRNELILQVIIKKWILFQRAHHHSPQQLSFFSLMREKLPHLTLSEMASRLKLQNKRSRQWGESHKHNYMEATSTYLGWKLVQLCQSPLSDKELREHFIPIFQEFLQLFPKEPIKAVEAFMHNYDLSWQEAPKEIQPNIVRRLVYIFNGLGKLHLGGLVLPNANIDLLLQRCEDQRYFQELDYTDSLNAALKEWVHSYKDTVFIGQFEVPFGAINRKELLKPLVEASLTLEEPLRSFHLRALVHGIEYITLPLTKSEIEEVFAHLGVTIPQEPVTRPDIYRYCSSFSDFIRSVNEAQTQEQLEVIIHEVLNLPIEQREIRLRAVAHNLEADLNEESLIACPLKQGQRKEVFARCGLQWDDFRPVGLRDFLKVEKKAFKTLV